MSLSRLSTIGPEAGRGSLAEADRALDASIAPLVDLLRRHRRWFILTGAGCSTDSGIPDYRDADGNWKHEKPVSHRAFVSSERVRRRYWARSSVGWPRFALAQPNAAHRALADLERGGKVLSLVTQNVDGLHAKAGSLEVIDLHGRLDRVECLTCGHGVCRHQLQEKLERLNPAWGKELARGTTTPDGDIDLGDVDHDSYRVPDCPTCGGILKPAVVFFGDSVPSARKERAFAALERADALLVVGSSLMIMSGYRFARRAVERGIPLAILNLGRGRADAEATVKIALPCADVLPRLVERLDEPPPAARFGDRLARPL